MEQRSDVLSEVARKFAASETPARTPRLASTSDTPSFSDTAEDCSFWCIVTRCFIPAARAAEPKA